MTSWPNIPFRSIFQSQHLVPILRVMWLYFVWCSLELGHASAFVSIVPTCTSSSSSSLPCGSALFSQLQQSQNRNLSRLPEGISPFEKSISKDIDVQGNFRTIAKRAVDAAQKDNIRLMEIEFPPLIGGDKSKSQFDDFDNIQELDSNKDWAVQFAPMFNSGSGRGRGQSKKTMNWLIFPDVKECEIARKEWRGGRYQDAATFTTIEAATNFLQGEGSYDSPWGAALASRVSKMLSSAKDKRRNSSASTSSILGDLNSLDSLVNGENAPPNIAFVIQPGNGGPVEDWINVEKIYTSTSSQATTTTTTCTSSSNNTFIIIINGALDKVRGGYYPKIFFPKLAACVDRFYNNNNLKSFTSVFYLKPISEKGVYGWLYRVYPEPWQVILQTINKNKKTKKQQQMNNNKDVLLSSIKNVIVYASDKRPSYNEAVNKLVAAAAAAGS